MCAVYIERNFMLLNQPHRTLQTVLFYGPKQCISRRQTINTDTRTHNRIRNDRNCQCSKINDNNSVPVGCQWQRRSGVFLAIWMVIRQLIMLNILKNICFDCEEKKVLCHLFGFKQSLTLSWFKFIERQSTETETHSVVINVVINAHMWEWIMQNHLKVMMNLFGFVFIILALWVSVFVSFAGWENDLCRLNDIISRAHSYSHLITRNFTVYFFYFVLSVIISI